MKRSHWSAVSLPLEERYQAVLGCFVQVGDSFSRCCFSLGTKSEVPEIPQNKQKMNTPVHCYHGIMQDIWFILNQCSSIQSYKAHNPAGFSVLLAKHLLLPGIPVF